MLCDVFCRVIDNFGDIGVCWRLARQLTREHAYRVRLWVDEPQALRALRPGVDPGAARQELDGVVIRRWPDRFPPDEPLADLVVEAFGCPLPEDLAERMSTAGTPPVWVNLEYLSAEPWIDGCHRMRSRHPRLPLTQHFFFPGFTGASGGLLREAGLLEARDRFRRDAGERDRFWATLGVPPPAAGERRVSVFCYENDSLTALFDAWATDTAPWTCLIPEGRALASAERALGVHGLRAGAVETRGRLSVRVLPFARQEDYDRLLWACDLNIVRGEDSFVRAQWAGRPFFWHIYPQDDGAHWIKLQAFLDRYTADLDAAGAQAVRAAMLEFNDGRLERSTWNGLAAALASLTRHADDWASRLAARPDLASQLAKFHQACVK